MSAPSFLDTAEGRRIAYHRTDGDGPGIVFLGGFKSDMEGTKATYLEEWARAEGRAFLRFDYSGHGQSEGAFTDGTIGDVTWFRAEHTEDFLADPQAPATWRTRGMANGTMGDLAPHIVNAALALIGPIDRVMAEVETAHHTRPGGDVTNDDHAQIMCRFASGVMGHIYASRIAMGRKMGYAYEITGTKGAIRFDQEDQNALWLYVNDGPEATRGFTKILTGPAHPDYEPFCQGPGHGTGYQDQIIIEARDFLQAIHTGQPVWPTFADGHAVNRVIAAALAASDSKSWQNVSDF